MDANQDSPHKAVNSDTGGHTNEIKNSTANRRRYRRFGNISRTQGETYNSVGSRRNYPVRPGNARNEPDQYVDNTKVEGTSTIAHGDQTEHGTLIHGTITPTHSNNGQGSVSVADRTDGFGIEPGYRRRVRVTPPHILNDRSVVQEPLGTPIAPLGDFIFSYATVADDLPAWGTNIAGRDRELRRFWPSEPMTASALYSMASKYSSLEWTLEGPPKTVGIYQRMLNSVEFGEGWISLMTKTITDLLSQDNGAFIEIIRMSDDPSSPVISLSHLDSNRCVRTGHRATPVMYYDLLGAGHLMNWYQVLALSEFPSPIERFRGIQVCAISRLLRAAQIMRDISVYEREKISGRFNRAIYFVSGPQQRSIKNALDNQRLQADSEGLTRYVEPLIVASLDPGSAVKVDKIDLASLPDNFNKEETLRWFIAQMALAFGGDYQDFAPLPGNNLGSGSQSRMLHQKSLSKGSRLFMKLMEQIMNYRGIIPTNIKFSYDETDPQDDAQKADLRLTRAKARQVDILSGTVTPEIARQQMADDGDLRYDYMMKMNQEPLADTIAAQAWDPLEAEPDAFMDIADPSAYTGTPEDQTIPGATNWGGGSRNGGDTSTTSQRRVPATAGGTVKTEARKVRGTSGG